MKRGNRYTPEMLKKAFVGGIIIGIILLVGGIAGIIFGNKLDSTFIIVVGAVVVACAVALLVSNIYDYIKGKK